MVEENEGSESPVKRQKRPLISRKVKTWIAAALSILVVILVIQNTQTVTVSVFFWDRPMPLVILILFVFFVGMAIGYILRRKR